MVWITKKGYKKLIMRFFKEVGYHAKLSKSKFAKKVFSAYAMYEKNSADNRGQCTLTHGPIDTAGIWYESEEGHEFWRAMNDEFFMFVIDYADKYHINNVWLRKALENFKISFVISDETKAEVIKAIERLE